MNEDQTDVQDEAEGAGEDYVAPALTDLGSFEDLTKLSPSGSALDSEGFS
jgi:hypothetical protein